MPRVSRSDWAPRWRTSSMKAPGSWKWSMRNWSTFSISMVARMYSGMPQRLINLRL